VNTKIDVPALRPFETLSWPEAAEVFENAARLPFRQAWQETLSPEFREGEVRVGWNATGLWVLASMTDDNIVTQATGNNQHLWSLGDVFEIFVRDLAGEEYLELHTDPNGFTLQLRFASERVIGLLGERKLKLADIMVTEPLFHPQVRVREGGWDVLACVSAVRGRSLRASFSRYDYDTVEGEPILSSTSAHKIVDFHDQPGWLDLELVD
jgi:hypothetical protein